jgi:hypothetical protein
MLLKRSDIVSECLRRAEECGRHAKNRLHQRRRIERPERTEVVSDQSKACLR